MNAGAYKHIITIEHQKIQVDEIGNDIPIWETYKTDYAYVNGLSGKEYWEASQTQSENTVDFTLRWKPYLDEINTVDYRIVFGGKVFNIKTVDNIRYANKNVKLRAEVNNG